MLLFFIFLRFSTNYLLQESVFKQILRVGMRKNEGWEMGGVEIIGRCLSECSNKWDNYDFEKYNFFFKIKKHIVKKLIMIKVKE